MTPPPSPRHALFDPDEPAGTALPEQWGSATRPVDFYDVKADVEALFAPRRVDAFPVNQGLTVLIAEAALK